MQTTFVRQAAELGGAPVRERPGSSPAASPGVRRGKGTPSRARQAAFKARGNTGANAERALIEALSNSKVFQDYERAFTEATGLPVALRAVESWQLPHHGHRNESPFLRAGAGNEPRVRVLPAGAGKAVGRRGGGSLYG